MALRPIWICLLLVLRRSFAQCESDCTPSPTTPTWAPPEAPTPMPTDSPTPMPESPTPMPDTPTPMPVMEVEIPSDSPTNFVITPTDSPTSTPAYPTPSPTAPTYNPSPLPTSPAAAPPTGSPVSPTTSQPATSSPTSPPETPTTTTPTTLSPTSSPTTPTTAWPTFVPTRTPTRTPVTAAPQVNLSSASVRVNITSGGLINTGDVIVSIPADPAWGSGGTLLATTIPFDPFVSSKLVVSSNEGLTNVASLEFIPDGETSSIPIPFLESPMVFSIRLSEIGKNLLSNPADICDGPVAIRIFPEALCSFYDHNSSGWNVSGCNRTQTSQEYVECSCNHLTEFAAILPKYNYVKFQDVLLVDQMSLERHPFGIVCLAVVYAIFGLALCYAIRFDKKEQQDAQLRSEKEAKWMATLNNKVQMSFWKRYKSELQKKHTWFSMFFRKKGSSYRSVDRTAVTLISVLTIMALNARFYGQTQTWAGYGAIVVLSALTSFIPLLTLEAIFTRIGPQGYKDQFELDHGIRRVPQNRFCQWWTYFRFPSWFGYVIYVVLFGVAVGLSVNILLLAFEFDSSREFVCNSKGTPSWIVSVLITIVINIFAVQPLKILVVCALTHSFSRARETGMMELPDSTQKTL